MSLVLAHGFQGVLFLHMAFKEFCPGSLLTRNLILAQVFYESCPGTWLSMCLVLAHGWQGVLPLPIAVLSWNSDVK